MKYIFIVFSLLIFLARQVNSQEIKYQNEFDFDREIAIKYAILALKEFARNTGAISLSNYKLDEPFAISLNSTACTGKPIFVVMVVFPHKNSSNSVGAILDYENGYFRGSLRTGGFISTEIESEIEAIKNPDPENKDYWNCGV